jgi:hypothetical protein
MQLSTRGCCTTCAEGGVVSMLVRSESALPDSVSMMGAEILGIRVESIGVDVSVFVCCCSCGALFWGKYVRMSWWPCKSLSLNEDPIHHYSN